MICKLLNCMNPSKTDQLNVLYSHETEQTVYPLALAPRAASLL